MNEELKTLLIEAIRQLKCLPSENFKNLKSQFEKIHNNDISVAESYRDTILCSNKIDMSVKVKVEEPFYDIGFLISISPRTSITNILKSVYQKDVPDGTIPFTEYQKQVMDAAYDLQAKSLDLDSN